MAMAAMGQGGGPQPSPPMPDVANNPMMGAAMGALDDLMPKSPNPTQAIAQVDQALKLAHELVMRVIPQVSQWNSKLAKEMHVIGKQLLTAKMDLKKEQGPQGPPPALMMGDPTGLMGAPPSGAGAGSYQM